MVNELKCIFFWEKYFVSHKTLYLNMNNMSLKLSGKICWKPEYVLKIIKNYCPNDISKQIIMYQFELLVYSKIAFSYKEYIFFYLYVIKNLNLQSYSNKSVLGVSTKQLNNKFYLIPFFYSIFLNKFWTSYPCA